MFPTTLGVSRAYFRWFLTEGGGKSNADLGIAIDLDTLSRGEGGMGDAGGERGNAFERYLAAKMTLTSNTTLMTRSISEDPTVKHSRTILIKDRVYTTCHLPPLNFRSYIDGTLLTHTDQSGGEHRLDLVYYGGQNEVIFIEATVGNYRQLKIPTKDDKDGLVKKILDSMQKWLGETMYDVTLKRDGSGLTVAYKHNRANPLNLNRPDPPTVHYVIATTCPNTVRVEKQRRTKYKWIQVCYLDDLVESGLFANDCKTGILKAQATHAGRVP